MAVRCREIVSLPSFKNVKLVAGANGLDRLVTWTYIVTTNSILNLIHGGELIFVAGHDIKHDDDSLRAILQESNSLNVSGIVFSLNEKYIRELPPEILKLADEIELPIFTVSWDVSRLDMTKELGEYIINSQNNENLMRDLIVKIIYDDSSSLERIVDRAEYFGYDLFVPHVAGIINIAYGENPSRINQNVTEYLMQNVQYVMHQYFEKALVLCSSDSAVFLIPIPNPKEDVYLVSLKQICKRLHASFRQYNFNIYVGNIYNDVTLLRQSYIQAKKTAEICFSKGNASDVVRFQDLNVSKLYYEVVNEKKMLAYCRETIGAVIEYDKTNDAELLKTIEIYFLNRFNLSKTAQNLYIHRNSLMYRLSRVEDIIGKSLDDPYVLLELINCVLYHKFCNSAK